MGLASINSIMCHQFGQFYKKAVLRLGEHGDAIENANNKVCPPQSFLANSVPDNNNQNIVPPAKSKSFLGLIWLAGLELCFRTTDAKVNFDQTQLLRIENLKRTCFENTFQ